VSQRDDGLWSVQFRREREASWRELEKLVAVCEARGVRSLGDDQTARLPVLYRAALSSLAVARSSVLDQNLREYLESLVTRAYLIVYAPKRGLGPVLSAFLLGGFPAAVRSVRWYVAASAGITLLGFAIGFGMVVTDHENYYLFVDAGMASGRDPSATTESLRQTLFTDENERRAGLLTFATMLFTHNSSVGILTYGLGFVFGLPVLLILLQNGMMLGAMSALFHERGLAVEWWSWILPHGVPELTAIVLCGAAGLAIGHRLVFPGQQSRVTAPADIGRRMGAVVGGSVLMLFVAGLVEGVFRQLVNDVPTRYGLATLFAFLWAAYFLYAGRKAR
jgi:uncharacterized membrane protein SpoIIM required for sporulation